MAAQAGSPPLPNAPPALSSWRTLLWSLLGLLALAYGWKVTRIDLQQFVIGFPNMQHIVAGLIQPDLLTQEVVTTSTSLNILVGPAQPGAVASPDGRLTFDPASLEPGQEFKISGHSLQPNTPARLFLVDEKEYARPFYSFTTNADGAFRYTFDLPASVTPGSYTLRADVIAPTGHWSISETLSLALDKIVETLFLALMGTFFGVLLSVPLSFLAARNLMKDSAVGRAIYVAVRTFFNLTRSIEVIIVAVIMTVVVGIGPFAGVLALAIHSVGALGKLYSESIEGIDPGPIEAITATGANRLQVTLYAVLPQVIPAFISFTLYRWDINVRMSTIIGLVGGGGIGYLLTQYINLLQWDKAGTTIWLIALIVIAMDYASAVLRERVT